MRVKWLNLDHRIIIYGWLRFNVKKSHNFFKNLYEIKFNH